MSATSVCRRERLQLERKCIEGRGRSTPCPFPSQRTPCAQDDRGTWEFLRVPPTKGREVRKENLTSHENVRLRRHSLRPRWGSCRLHRFRHTPMAKMG